jgi:hypothetical protein
MAKPKPKLAQVVGSGTAVVTPLTDTDENVKLMRLVQAAV